MIVSVDELRAEEVVIGAFSNSDLSGWKEKEFDGITSYSLTDVGGTIVLQARSDDSASALAKKQRLNLAEFPYLNWSWRIEATLDSGDERLKSGDD